MKTPGQHTTVEYGTNATETNDPPVVVVPTSRGTQYVLPYRKSALLRWAGVVLFVPTSFLFAVAASWMSFATQPGALYTPFVAVTNIIVGAFAALLAAGGVVLLIIAVSLMIARTRCRVVVTAEQLRSTEYFGFIRRTFKRSRRDIERLGPVWWFSAHHRYEVDPPDSLQAMCAVVGENTIFPFAFEYPRDVLEALGSLLSDELEVPHHPEGLLYELASDICDEREGVQFAQQSSGVVSQPADSMIIATCADDGSSIQIEVPGSVIARPGKQLLIIALFWTVIAIVIAIVWINSGFLVGRGVVATMVCALPFLISGVIGVIAARRYRNHPITIDVNDEEVRIAAPGLLRARLIVLDSTRIVAVRVAEGWCDISSESSLVLEFVDRWGGSTRVLHELSDPDLHWLASIIEPVLDRALRQHRCDLQGTVGEPCGTDITLQRGSDSQLNICVPATGWRRARKSWKGACIAGAASILLASIMFAVRIRSGVDIELLMWATFIISGPGAFVFGLHGMRMRTFIDVIDDDLLISRKGLFRPRQWQFSLADIASIQVGPSESRVNNEVELELHIHLRDDEGNPFRLLSQRSNAELYWLSYELRRELQDRAT